MTIQVQWKHGKARFRDAEDHAKRKQLHESGSAVLTLVEEGGNRIVFTDIVVGEVWFLKTPNGGCLRMFHTEARRKAMEEDALTSPRLSYLEGLASG